MDAIFNIIVWIASAIGHAWGRHDERRKIEQARKERVGN